LTSPSGDVYKILQGAFTVVNSVTQ